MSFIRVVAIGTALVALLSSSAVYAGKYKYSVLHAFSGGKDGCEPTGALLRDSAGNLYGTTSACGTHNHGTVFELSPGGTLTVLYSFHGAKDGGLPLAGLTRDDAGNLYGTASADGYNNSGVVFKIAPDGRETTLHRFGTQSGDGYQPRGTLLFDDRGDLFGTTAGGGADNWGTVFKITAKGKESILYSFSGGSDGGTPVAGLIMDQQHDLYGTTWESPGASGGVIFKLDAAGKESVLYAFTGNEDGASPLSALFRDKRGNLFGTADESLTGGGLIFKLTSDGTESNLYVFSGGDGASPHSGLISDLKGNLYGTTEFGGRHTLGTVYALSKPGKETVLHSFAGRKDGASPVADLVMDSAGNLYGTAQGGGPNSAGVIFRLQAK